VLELGADEGDSGYLGDSAGAGGDVLEDGPPRATYQLATRRATPGNTGNRGERDSLGKARDLECGDVIQLAADPQPGDRPGTRARNQAVLSGPVPRMLESAMT
jgi:hypothetical protein